MCYPVNNGLILVRLNKAHTGVYLAQKLAKSLRDYGIHEKVGFRTLVMRLRDIVLTLDFCRSWRSLAITPTTTAP